MAINGHRSKPRQPVIWQVRPLRAALARIGMFHVYAPPRAHVIAQDPPALPGVFVVIPPTP